MDEICSERRISRMMLVNKLAARQHERAIKIQVVVKLVARNKH